MIIQFKKPTPEDEFMDSLTDKQLEQFYEIIKLAEDEFNSLNKRYLNKVVECEQLKMELKLYKK